MDMGLFKEMAAKAQGKSLIDACLAEIGSLRQQLAAALAACEAKDTALRQYYSTFKLAEKALAIKPDSSALKAHDDALIERVIDHLCKNGFGFQGVLDAIRALKE